MEMMIIEWVKKKKKKPDTLQALNMYLWISELMNWWKNEYAYDILLKWMYFNSQLRLLMLKTKGYELSYLL